MTDMDGKTLVRDTPKMARTRIPPIAEYVTWLACIYERESRRLANSMECFSHRALSKTQVSCNPVCTMLSYLFAAIAKRRAILEVSQQQLRTSSGCQDTQIDVANSTIQIQLCRQCCGHAVL